MKLESLAEKLELDGIGVQGRSIFVHHMPEEVAVGVLMLDGLTGSTINYELPGLFRTGFQVIVRHSNYSEGMALAEAAMASLTLMKTSLKGMNIHWVRPKHTPIVFPISKGDLLEFSVNYEAVYVAT